MRSENRIRGAAFGYVLAGLLAAAAAAQPGASVVGEWESQMNWGLEIGHMVVLKTKDVLGVEISPGGLADVILFDPATGDPPAGVPAPPNSYNLYCAGHTQLPSGKVLFAGGGGGNPVGVKLVVTYDPDVPADPWTAMDDIPAPGETRWYPTATTLGTGKVLLTAGRFLNQNPPAPLVEDVPAVFNPTKPTGQQWIRMNPATAEKIVENYPYMFQLTSGKVFMAGSYWFRPDWPPELALDSYNLNVVLETWSTAVARAAIPGGSGVMYRPDKIMKGGGSHLGNRLADMYTIDLATPDVGWTAISSMNHARRHFYLIVMPDSKIIAVGGETTKTPEIYDPDADTWQDMAAHDENRFYHSAAVLLTDARVLIAGGEFQGQQQHTAQIFKPPYLFDNQNGPAPRPTISSAPAAIDYGKSFKVYSPDAPNVVSVVLVGLGAATHSFDQNQRYVPLQFVAEFPDILKVSPPSNWNIASPSYYMLFILVPGDRTGVLYPSLAEMVRLRLQPEPGA